MDTVLRQIFLVWAGLAAVIVLLRWITKEADDGTQPKRLGCRIPFIGHAFKLAGDKRQFFNEAFQKCMHEPFSMLIAGRRHYVFSDLADVGAIHRNVDDITFKWPKLFVYTHLLGFNKQDAELMWEVDKEAERIDHRWLLGRDEQAETTAIYLRQINEYMTKLDRQIQASGDRSIEVDGLQTVIDLEGMATVVTFYGNTTVKRHPGIMKDLVYIVTKGFKPLLFEFPRFLASEVYGARDRIINAFMELYEQLDTRKGISGYFIDRYRYLKSREVPPSAAGADMFRHLFASLLNSLPTTYLALLHILQSPELMEAVRRELEASGYCDASPEDRVLILPDRVPLLRSIWFETLRVHNNLVTLRHVERDTKISSRPEWSLRKDHVVSIPAAVIHYNEALHPGAEEFRPRRFMEKALGGEGENPGRTLKPFGGGASYCPGRAFGERQMMGFIAALVMKYDINIVEQDFQIPPNGDFDDLWVRPRCHWAVSNRVALNPGTK